MHSHHFGPLPAGRHGPAMKCQQMHDDHRHAGGQTSPCPVCAQPSSSTPCPGMPTACLVQSNRSTSWHHFVLSQRISQHLSEVRKQKVLMFWWSWSPDQGGEERQVSYCGSAGPGDSIMVKAACLLEKSPNMGSVLLRWGQGQNSM